MVSFLWLFTTWVGSGLAVEPPRAEPIPEPTEDLAELIETAGTAADHDGADVVLVFDRTKVKVEDSGLAHYRRRRLFKVLSEKGATSLAALRFDYDPQSNMVEVTTARILRPPKNGKPVPPTELGSDHVRDLPQPQRHIYWGPRMKVLSVPRLMVGDALEIETYTKGFIIAYLGDTDQSTGAAADEERFVPPMRGHFYDVVLFGDAAMPTLERRYAVTLPRDKPLQFEVYNGEVYSAVDFDQTSTTYRFWRKGLPAHAPEAKAASASDYLTKVVMATVPDWPTKSRWFAEVNEKQFAATPPIRQKVAEITRGASTPAEKISAILHWTAQEIRYSGISMGKGEGYTLHSGEMTFNDRAGVCKDIAGMAITLLRAAGFVSYPAMTMAGARVERVPADQFNHCVVAVKTAKGYEMIDPTWAPFSAELWSSAEREQHYVIGSPKGEQLMRTPYLPPEHNQLNIKGTSTIDRRGNLTGVVTVTATGYPEDRLRRLIAYRSVTGLRTELEQRVAQIAPHAVLDRFRFGDHRDLETPFVVELAYHVDGFAAVSRQTLRTRIPLSRHLFADRNLADWLLATGTDQRTAAIWLRSPQLVTLRESITVPAGYHLTAGRVDREIESALGRAHLLLEQKKNSLKFVETIRINQRNIAPKDYAELKKVADTYREYSRQGYFLIREGGAS